MVRRLLGVVFCILFVLASGASAAELQKISVGYVPVADFAPLFVAKDKGFFEKHGLDVTLTKILLASNVPGALVAGSLDIGMGTPPMLLVTSESGLDFEAIAAVSRLKKDHPFVSLIARKQDNITDAAQLKDKKVGVPGFNSSMDITFRKWLMDRHISQATARISSKRSSRRCMICSPAASSMRRSCSSRSARVSSATAPAPMCAISSPISAPTPLPRSGWRSAIGSRRIPTSSTASAPASPKASPISRPTRRRIRAIQMKYLGFASPARPDWSLKVSKEDLTFFADISKQVGLIHQMPQIDKLIAP